MKLSGLLNSPDWSPDGEFIVARKHFTNTRSLGAGEVWQYHKTGGTGVMLTAKANDEKDLGEPAFSPDGQVYLFLARRHAGQNLSLQQRLRAGYLCD